MVGELTIALSHLLSEGAVAVDGEIEALVRQIDVQAHGVVGIRVADHGLVIIARVDLAVTIDVLEHHVARLQGCALE